MPTASVLGLLLLRLVISIVFVRGFLLCLLLPTRACRQLFLVQYRCRKTLFIQIAERCSQIPNNRCGDSGWSDCATKTAFGALILIESIFLFFPFSYSFSRNYPQSGQRLLYFALYLEVPWTKDQVWP